MFIDALREAHKMNGISAILYEFSFCLGCFDANIFSMTSTIYKTYIQSKMQSRCTCRCFRSVFQAGRYIGEIISVELNVFVVWDNTIFGTLMNVLCRIFLSIKTLMIKQKKNITTKKNHAPYLHHQHINIETTKFDKIAYIK